VPEVFHGHDYTNEDRWLVATTPDEALGRLVFAQEHKIVETQERTLKARRRLAEFRARFDAARTDAQPGDLVTFVVGPSQVEVAVRLVLDAAVDDLSICDIHVSLFNANEDASVLVATPEQLDRGTVFRSIYDHTIYDNLPERGRQVLALSRAQGEIQRFVPELPIRMVLADQSAALVALTLTGVDGALLVRSKPMLAMLRSFFDLLWEQAERIAGDASGSLPGHHARLITLLAQGLGDEAIARDLGVGLRTARRAIAALMADLGATTRYQAGACAQRHGLLANVDCRDRPRIMESR
jgi:hypothetical protein